MRTYTESELNNKTVAELREICRASNIPGMSKARKDIIVAKIIEGYPKPKNNEATCTTVTTSTTEKNNDDNGKLSYINANLHSFLENNSYKTLISVSCGASSSNYPVVGRSVGFVKATYKEILNINPEAEGIVNGVKVADSYVMKSGDTLEFVRKAGTKG